MIIKFAKVRQVNSPKRGHATDAGIDLFAPDYTDKYVKDLISKNLKVNEGTEIYDTGKITLRPGQSVLIPSGIIFEIDYGAMGLLLNKSGVAAKKHLLVGAQVIDTFYDGEVHINLNNVGSKDEVILPGDKLVQMTIIPVLVPNPQEVEKEEIYEHMLMDKVRGDGGFGSTDKKE